MTTSVLENTVAPTTAVVTTTETTVQPTAPTTTEPTTTTGPTTTEPTTTETTETTTTTTETTTTTAEEQPATVKVSGQAGLRLGASVVPGPNLLRLNFFNQESDERALSIVYTGLTNTGAYSANLRTDITYRVDVVVCCNAPTVTLSFRDLRFDQATTLDLTVSAVEVVFEVVSEAGGPVADATIVIPAASGSNAQATWSARVYAAPTDENGETRTVLPIGTSSNEDRLPTLELADGVKTTFQFTVLGGPETEVDGPTEPVPTTAPPTTTAPLPTTAPPASEPTTTASTIISVPTTTELAPTETIATTTEATIFAALEGDLEDGTETSEQTPSTESATTEQASPELTTTVAPSTTSTTPGPAPATTVNNEPTTTTQPESSTTTELATSQTSLQETTILETTSVPNTDQPGTSTPDTTTPVTTNPNTPTSDTGSPDDPDPIAPTPDGTNTVRITLVAPTSIELSGKAGLEILGELTPGSHSLRINFYRADTEELGAQVTYTGDDNDGSYETHLIQGATYRVEVIVCCEGPTIRLVYDDLVFTESTVRDLLVPAARFEIKVLDHEDAAVDDAAIVFDELGGAASNDATPWYASGQPKFDSDSTSFPVVLPLGSVISTDQAGEEAEEAMPTSLIVGDADAVSFTVPTITFNINTLVIKLNEDGGIAVTESALTRPWVTPTLSVEANEAGWINAEAEINWTVTDPAPEVGLPQTTLPPTPVDKEGTHTYWSEEACDLDENCSKGSLEVSLDSKGPSVGIHGFVKGAFRTTEPTPTCTAEDSGSGLLLITIDDDGDNEQDSDENDDDESNSAELADCTLETKVRSSEPIIADAVEDEAVGNGTGETDEEASERPEEDADPEEADESAELSEPTLFLTTYEVTATATDIAGNVTTEVETYQMETEDQVEVTATLPETVPPTTQPPTTEPTTTIPPTSDPEPTTTPETTTAPETTISETTTVPEPTTPETTISETTTVPETTVPDTNSPETAPPETTTEPEETSPTPGAVSRSRLVRLR